MKYMVELINTVDNDKVVDREIFEDLNECNKYFLWFIGHDRQFDDDVYFYIKPRIREIS